MLKNLFGLLILLSMAACSNPSDPMPEESKAENILPYPIQQKKLNNGLNVVVVEYPSPGLAAFQIVMRVGARDEVEAGKTGFAHFFEHMMFRGTDNYSSDEYSEVLKSIGAAANANTWLDRTVYHMTGNAKMLDKMFEIEADRFMNLNYSVHDFKTEAGAVKGEYTKNNASPYAKLSEKTAEVAFTKHTYGHTTMGYWEDVVDMPNQYDYSLKFFEQFYRPEYATILVVGDVNFDNVYALADKYFGIWEKGNFKSDIPVEPEQMETRSAHVEMAGFPPYLELNYSSPAFNDTAMDVAALDIVSTILFSERSDLYKKLVIDEQKVRYINGGFFFTRDPYLYSVSASVVNEEDMQYVKDEIDKALEKVKTQAVDSTLLEQTKSKLKYSAAMNMDSPSSIAGSLAFYIWVAGEPESLNNIYRSYDKVSAEDIMKAADKYFVSNHLTISTISSQKEGGIK
jgi:zinc protease